MWRIEHDDVVQTLAANRADQPFNVWILPKDHLSNEGADRRIDRATTLRSTFRRPRPSAAKPVAMPAQEPTALIVRESQPLGCRAASQRSASLRTGGYSIDTRTSQIRSSGESPCTRCVRVAVLGARHGRLFKRNSGACR